MIHCVIKTNTYLGDKRMGEERGGADKVLPATSSI